MSERHPKHDLDAERAVLSALMVELSFSNPADRWREIDPILSASDFFNPANRRVYEAIAALYREGKTVDIQTVASELKARERLVEVGGAHYLATLTDAAPTPERAVEYAEIVGRTARQRAGVAIAQRIVAEGYGDVGDVDDWLARTAKELAELSTSGSSFVDYRPIRDVIVEAEQARMEAQRRGTPPMRLPSGLRSLDEFVTLRPKQLVIVGAAAGVGKTSFMGGILLHVANQAAWQPHERLAFPGEVPHALLVSMEMDDLEMGDRLLFGAARVSKRKHERNQLDAEETQHVVSAAAGLAELPLFLMDRPGVRLTDLRRNIRALARESREWRYEFDRRGRLRLVVIDYLTLLKLEGRKGASRSEIVGDATRELKVLAGEEEICIVLASQLNRTYAGRKDPRPVMADIRDSGEIEQNADIILFPYRDEVHNPGTKLKKFGEIIVAKQRNGPSPARVFVRWRGEYTMFEDLTFEDRAELASIQREERSLCQAT